MFHLYEIVGAYSTYVNGGIHTQPFYITRIEDKNGNVIENFVPKTRQAISEQTAFKMIYMLMGGVEEAGGTSVALPYDLKKDNEIGGKTGTTNNASDGWYMGSYAQPGFRSLGRRRRTQHTLPRVEPWSRRKNSTAYLGFLYDKVYADPTIEYKKGQFKRPASGMDISLDCRAYEIRLILYGVTDENWDPNQLSNGSALIDRLKEIVHRLPDSPGVYKFYSEG